MNKKPTAYEIVNLFLNGKCPIEKYPNICKLGIKNCEFKCTPIGNQNCKNKENYIILRELRIALSKLQDIFQGIAELDVRYIILKIKAFNHLLNKIKKNESLK